MTYKKPPEVVAAPSPDNENLWFIYRNNSQEIKVDVRNGMVSMSSHKLRPHEVTYLLNQIKK